MADKLKVLFLYIVYPLAMGTYFKRALERRPDIDLKVVGPYSGAFIPWLGGLMLPVKYAIPPDLPLPYPIQNDTVSYDIVKSRLGTWKPDLVLTADAGIRWASKPSDGIVAHIATDPHVLDYSLPRSYSDKFFNMQKVYSEPKDIWLPYATDPTIFHYSPAYIPTYDACLVGMPYSQRIDWVESLRRKGYKVAFENGPIFEEARELYAHSRIGLNWSSRDDLNARVFEVMGMGFPLVTNRVSDLPLLFKEGRDYLGFSTLDEAVEKVTYALNLDNSDEMSKMSESAMNIVNKEHTYDARINQILTECGF